MPRIGDFALHAIECGRLRLDGGAMFGVVPKVLWQRYAPADDRNRIQLSMRALLLERHDRLILIDNGAGDKHGARFRDMFNLEECTLERSLERAGFGADEVTDVIITHLHFDHAGGSTIRMGNRCAPRFKNATYHVQRDHFENAEKPNPRERASFLPDDFEPLNASGQLNLVEGPGPFLPGVELIVINGHTTAQQIVRVAGPEGTLVYVADLLPTVHHLRLPWIMAYDIRPLVTLEEKMAFLNEALKNNWQLFFEHDPEIAIAGVKESGRGATYSDPRPLCELF